MTNKQAQFFTAGTCILEKYTGCKYKIVQSLGRGAYAQCFECVDETGRRYALKAVKLLLIKSETVMKKLETEIEIHSSLNSPHIVKMYKSFRTEEFVFILLELCEKGSLDKLLKKEKRIKEKHASRFIKQIIQGLQYLHGIKCVVHRDLKLANILLDGDMNIKIADFGLSAVVLKGRMKRTLCGTPNYIAPEIISKGSPGHSFEADIWSLGVIVYSLLIGVPPFQRKSISEIYDCIKSNRYIFPENHGLSNISVDIISRILVNEPSKRPTLCDLLNHKFITAYKESLARKICGNIALSLYSQERINEDHVVYSFPMDIVKGVGYICHSGNVGIFYQNNENVILLKRSLVVIKSEYVNGYKKVLRTEEFPLDKLKPICYTHINNIKYFIQNFTDLSWATLKLNSTYEHFLAKVKKITDGLLFVMTNSIFIFDFISGEKVVVAYDGMLINMLDEDGLKTELTEESKSKILTILKMFP